MINNKFINQFKKELKNNEYISSKIDHTVLNKLGFFVVKKVFKKKIIDKYRVKFLDKLKKKKITRTKKHLVEFKIDKMFFFKNIFKEPGLKKIVRNFYDGNVGCDFYRVIKKDHNNQKPVFCHQDIAYQFGSFDRYSLFIALTENNNLNGGLIVYPSTHKFGYLGDAGQISNKITKNFIKLCPNLEIGDILIMHSCLWHESDKNFSKKNRIYLEVHIQNSNDPSTKFVILGKKKSLAIPFDKKRIFSNSRTQRIKILKKELKKLKQKLA